MKVSFLISLFIFSFFVALPQEGLRPLSSNLNYVYKDLQLNTPVYTASTSLKTQTVSLQIPFKDDFYYATLNNYPRVDLWEDSSVYINCGFPIAPPSIGVATFDGLNKFGYPYDPNLPNLNESLPADTLTSRPINLFQSGSQILQPSDSVALSFYYQARGNGEPPEVADSLILDFYKPIPKTWLSRVWFSKGNTNPNTNDTVFHRAFVWINDTAFLHDGFQFRMRNKATTAGNFDHWNVDYIYLAKNRSIKADTIYNDITFAHVPSSFLANYFAMPYEQYNPNEMGQKNSVRIKNNWGTALNMSYESRFYDKNNTQVHLYQGGADNLHPFVPYGVSNPTTNPGGYSTYPLHANPTFNYTYPLLADTCFFKIKHYLQRSTGASSDFIVENDTVFQFQNLKNYYAYDDGSAEAGYYVNALNGKMAIKFSLNYPDSLRSVRIYFDPTGSLTTVEQSSQFKIMLWSNSGNGPGTLIYTDTTILRLPRYTDDVFKGFPEYKLSNTQTLGIGTYYIGIEQKVSGGITIGYDVNQDYHQNVYYNLGNSWYQSQLLGSLMIRPVFGKFVPHPVSVKDNIPEKNSILVYPNPGNDMIHLVQQDDKKRDCLLFNSLGQLVLEEKIVNQHTSFSISEFPDGIYFLILKEGSLTVQQKKIIIQH